MQIVIIGDTHSRVNWKKIDFSKYDKAIFMGDYFDPYSYDISYDDRLKTFQEIIELKKTSPTKFVLLFGNHDLHYLPLIQPYSRFDSWFGRHYGIGEKFKEFLENDTLQIAYSLPEQKILFTHAGVSIKWYNLYVLNKKLEEVEELPQTKIKDASELLKLEAKLNELGKKLPEYFDFAPVYWDNYGVAPEQGPLWWRALDIYDLRVLRSREVLGGITQVNGHTQVPELLELKGENESSVVFVDGLGSGWYTELTVSDSGEYTFKQVNIE